MKTLKNFFGKTHIKLLCLFIVAMFCAVSALAFSNPIDAEAEKASPTIISETETIQASRTITTAAQLVSYANLVNSGSGRSDTVTLGCNIDMSSYSSFTPIGSSSSRSFTGTFNGNGFAITGLTVTGGSYNRGLFGYTSGATIKNLVLQGCSVTAVSGWCAGAFVGDAYNTRLEYCYNLGTTVSTATSGTTGIGGLVGYASEVTIVSCFNNGYVNGTRGSATTDCGGIVGKLISGTIQYCQNLGTVSAGSSTATYATAGGIFGLAQNGTISHCVNKGSLSVNAKIVTESWNLANISKTMVNDHDWVEQGIETSTMTSKVKSAYVGGIGGKMDAGSVSNCVNLDSSTYRTNGGYDHLHYKLSYKMINKYGLFHWSEETTHARFFLMVKKATFYNNIVGYMDKSATRSGTYMSKSQVETSDVRPYGCTSSTTGYSNSTVDGLFPMMPVNSPAQTYYGTNGDYFSLSISIRTKDFSNWDYATPQVVVYSGTKIVYQDNPYRVQGNQDPVNQGTPDSLGTLPSYYSSTWALDSNSKPYLKRFYWANDVSTPS